MYLSDEERYKILLRLKEPLEKEMGCKYHLFYPDDVDSIDLVWDVKVKVPVLPKFLSSDNDDVSIYRMEKKQWDENLWVEQWTDPDPPAVRDISLFDCCASMHAGKAVELWFMIEKYYNVLVYEELKTLKERADMMKAALIIPAAVKDQLVFDKILDRVLSKYNLSKSKFHLFFPDRLCGSPVELTFRYEEILQEGEEEGEEEEKEEEKEIRREKLVENLLRSAKALAEWWRDFRAWLVSLERMKMYESTKVDREFFRLCKWPCDDYYEPRFREDLRKFSRVYNLDRCLVKLVNNEIVVDRTKQIEPFPLEKIVFLKEDFPELFK